MLVAVFSLAHLISDIGFGGIGLSRTAGHLVHAIVQTFSGFGGIGI